jgi:hypothetical protein
MNSHRNNQFLVLAGTSLILATLACNAPSTVTPTTPLPIPTTSQTRYVTPTPSPTPLPTDTPVPDVPGPEGCTLNAVYVADVTVPDDTEFTPGTAFNKVWRVRNSGTCTWEAGTQLVFVSGERMCDQMTVDIPQAIPDSDTDVSLGMTAPSTPGTYRSTWQLQSPDGVRFGSKIYVQIIVPAKATAEPTKNPTEEPTGSPTGTPTLPDLVINDIEIDTDDPRQGMLLHVIVTLSNQGGATAEDFYWAWRICVHDGCEYIEAPGDFTLGPGGEIVAQMEYLFAGWSTYTTEAWADSREEIEEHDETNNTLQLVIPVKEGRPDLMISAITFAPDPPIQGQNTTVEVSVHNQGSKDSGAFGVEWWGGVNFTRPSCEWAVDDGLAMGHTTTLECTFAYSSWYGTITTRALVDVDDDVVELDETNNALDRDTPVNRP